MSASEEPTPETDVREGGDDDTPDIEEDIVEERLRIDGICGVY